MTRCSITPRLGFFCANPDGRVTYMNVTLRTWLGVGPDAAPPRLDEFAPEDAGRVLGKGRRPSSSSIRVDVTLRARSGVETPATVVTSWPNVKGSASSRSVVYGPANTGASAVPQSAAAGWGEAGLHQLDQGFASAPFGVARLDTTPLGEALIEDANPALLEMTKGAAAPGARFSHLFKLESDEALARLERADVDAPDAIELTLASQEKRGEVRVYFAPDHDGRALAFVLDAAGEKDTERQLHQSQKMQAVGQLAGGVAHDMRNFLQIMRTNLDLLLLSHPAGDPSFKPLDKISQAIAGSASLVRQLLAFSRRQTVKPEVIDLSETLSDLGVLLRQLLGDQIQLDVRHGRDAPHVKVDKTQLQAAIMNLSTNARDAMRPGGGTLTIRTSRATHDDVKGQHAGEVAAGAYALIEVADTGCGMDEETLEKIFEPFFTTKAQGEGTGLGLAMVFGIVKQAGGHVLVDSAVGAGTTFKVYLPSYTPTTEELDALANAAQEASGVGRKPTDLSGGGRILLVEDNEGVRQGQMMALQLAGYEVVEACDGEEALEILEEEEYGAFAVMISDVMMPGMGGPELYKTARELLNDTHVVFVSGFSEDQFADVLSDDHSVSFLEKPVTTKALTGLLKKLLRG